MIKLLSLFSGIGAPEQALKNIGIDFDLVGFSEIDKFAIKSYCTVHGANENLNLGDITKIDIQSLPKDIDLITHGSPCQDFSIAGKQKGGDKGAETRSSLMWNTVDIVEHCKPKYVLWENVKNLLSKKHKHNFDAYIEIMDKLGYNNYYKVLNAKDYGIPQNRERIFTISIRKDIDNNTFTFPEPFDNGLRLKDILEDEVDEKYYINTEKADKLIEQFKIQKEKEFLIGGEQKHQSVKYDGISTTLTSSMGTGGGYVPMTNIYPCMTPDRINKRQNGRRFKEDGEPMFTLTTQDKHGVLEEKIIDKNTNNINKIEIPQKVQVRKYKVDCDKLKVVLRNAKNESRLSIKDIAEQLNKPKTLVEHWFRNDECFSIPDADIWFELKKILHINIDDFDNSITIFEEKDSVYDSENRVYFTSGVSPTITCSKNSSPKICIECPSENDLHFVGGIGDKDIVEDNKKYSRNYPQGNRVYSEEGIACSQTANGGGIGGPTGLYLTSSAKRIGGIFDSGKSKHQAGSVWDKDYLSPTLDTMQGGWRQPCIIMETPCIVASRGRKPKNTSDRTPGIYTQRLEINKNGTSNTLTTVQKDNYVLVKEATEKQATSDEYRIRKLTPLECWRLMGFKDEQFNKAQSVCSNSQLYKQAGNSIVVDVLEKIFENIFKSEE